MRIFTTLSLIFTTLSLFIPSTLLYTESQISLVLYIYRISNTTFLRTTILHSTYTVKHPTHSGAAAVGFFFLRNGLRTLTRPGPRPPPRPQGDIHSNFTQKTIYQFLALIETFEQTCTTHCGHTYCATGTSTAQCKHYPNFATPMKPSLWG